MAEIVLIFAITSTNILEEDPMKKIIISILAFMMLGFVLCGCNGEKETEPTTQPTADPTTDATTEPTTEPTDTSKPDDTDTVPAFTNVTVIRRDDQTFDVTCNAVEGASYYVTKRNAFSQNARVEAEVTGDTAGFTVTVEEDVSDLYLWMMVGTKKVSRHILIPDTAVSVMLEDDGSAKIYSNCENPNAVSGYYDAEGKSLYRSAKSRFDEEAQLVGEGLSLSSKSDVDSRYTFKTPYYFVGLTSKDGVVTYVTEVGQETSCLIQYAYASMKLDEQEMPILHVVGRVAENEVAYTYRLALRQDGGQIIYAPNTGDAENLVFDLDLSPMQAEGTWYDIYIEIEETHAIYDLRAGLCDDSSVQWEANTYSFKQYDGALKVTFAVDRLGKTEASLELIDGKPMLVVITKLAGDQTFEGVSSCMEIRYSINGVKTVLQRVENSSDKPNELKFCFDMSQMTQAGNWHDIVVVIGDTETEVTSGAVDTSQTLSHGGRTYCFKVWNDLLKITY